MQPIRILHVFTIMSRGGAETMIMNYYRALDRTKVQFDFLVHREEKGAYDDEIKELGGRIFTVPAISPKNYFSYHRAGKDFFKEHGEYEIIHSHINALGFWILKIAKQQGVPVRIAHSHTALEALLKKLLQKNIDLKNTIKGYIQSFTRLGIRRNANHYFACSQKARDWLFGKQNREQVTVINNAIHAERFSYDQEKALAMKKELGLEQVKIIGHIGNFTEAKNHFFLLKIFAGLVAQKDNLRLLLVGGGQSRSKIETEIKRLGIENKVILLGVRSDIPDILQTFDLFFFPSLYEGLPVTVIEAQASGLRVVASDTITKEVQITELITFLSLKDTEEKWADTLLQNLSYERGDMYHKIVTSGYDIEDNAKKLQDFYLKVQKNS